MIAKGLYCTNFMRFREFSLPSLPLKGIIGIFGENESGKSTIGEMICFSLFGRTTKADGDDKNDIIKWKANECKVTMDFSIEGHDYTVERIITRSNEEYATLLDRSTNSQLSVGPKEVNDKLCSLLGFGFREFRYSLYIAQGELDLILSDSEDRKTVLNNMLGIGKIEKIISKVRNKYTEVKRELSGENDKLESKLKMIDELELKKKESEFLSEKIDSLEKELYSKKKRKEEINTILQKVEEGLRKREKLPVVSEKINLERERLKGIEEEIESLKNSVSRISSIEGEIQNLENEREEINRNKIPEIMKKMDLSKSYELLKKKIEQREKILDEKNRRFNEIHNRLIRIREIEQKLDKLENNLQSINSFITSISSKPNTINRMRENYMNLKNLHDDILLLFVRENQLIFKNEETLLSQLKKTDDKIKNSPIIEINKDKINEVRKKIRSFAKRKYAILTLSVLITILSISGKLFLSAASLYLLLLLLPFAFLFANLDRKIDHQRLEEYKLQEEENIANITNLNLEELRKEREATILQIEKVRLEITEAKRKEGLWKKMSFKNIEEINESVSLLNSENFKIPTNFKEHLNNFIRDYKSLFSDISDIDFNKIITQSEYVILNDLTTKKEDVFNEIKELKRSTLEKEEQLREIDFILKEIESFQFLILNYRKELELYSITDADAKKIQEGKDTLLKRIREIQETIENKRRDISIIQEEYGRFKLLEGKKQEIVTAIDKNLQELYEVKSSLKGLDLYESKAEEMKEELTQIEPRILDLSQMLAGALGEKKQIDLIISSIPQLKREIYEIKGKITNLQKNMNLNQELERKLYETAKEIKRRLIPQIESYFSWILPKLIKDRYLKVRLSDDFFIQVYSPEKMGYIPLTTLSRGTIEQLLITLRLAFSKAVTTKSKKQFLFLDEPFSSFDTLRRNLFFELLRSLQEDFEQIFVISHLPKLEEKMDAFLLTSLEDIAQPVKTSWEGQLIG